MEGMGKEKLYFLLLKLVKRKKPSLGQSLSTHFVADCKRDIFWRAVVANISKYAENL